MVVVDGLREGFSGAMALELMDVPALMRWRSKCSGANCYGTK